MKRLIIGFLIVIMSNAHTPMEHSDICGDGVCNPTELLTTSQIQSFHDIGFLVLDNFFTDEQVRRLEEATILTERSKEVVGGVWKYFNLQTSSQEDKDKVKTLDRVEFFVDIIPGWSILNESSRIGQIVGQLFGEPAFLWKEKINFKKPRSASGFEAHQDVQAGWSENGMSCHITVAISIDQTTIENGCLEVAPYSHQRGMLGPIRKGIPQDVVEELQWTKIPTDKKTIVIFGSYVPHKSEPNTSGKQRRLLLATYGKKTEESIESRKIYYEKKKKFAPPDILKDPKQQYRGYLI